MILTGTPEGVGPMLPGQEVTVTVEGIGSLTNVVATDRSGRRPRADDGSTGRPTTTRDHRTTALNAAT